MNEISKKLYCVVIRNGIEIWVDESFAERLKFALAKLSGHSFVPFENRILNTADITGVFTAEDMEEYRRRKNGQWKCNKGKWHDKADHCECWRSLPTFSDIDKRTIEKYQDMKKNHGLGNTSAH